jgi:hypothetical protein
MENAVKCALSIAALGIDLIPGEGCEHEVGTYLAGSFLDLAQPAGSEAPVPVARAFAAPFLSDTKLAISCLEVVPDIGLLISAVEIGMHSFDVLKDCQCVYRRKNVVSLDTDVVASFDPNELIGAAGTGSLHYLSPVMPWPYTVAFVNLETSSTARPWI